MEVTRKLNVNFQHQKRNLNSQSIKTPVINHRPANLNLVQNPANIFITPKAALYLRSKAKKFLKQF